MQILLASVPYAIAAMVAAPLVVVVSTLIVSNAQQPIARGSLFVLGAVLVDLPITLVVLLGFGTVNSATGGKGLGPVIDVIVGLAFVGLGIKALRGQDSAEHQATLRARAEQIANSAPKGLVLAGILAQLINVDAILIMMGGMKEIASASPSAPRSTVVAVVAICLFVMLVPYHLPIDLCIAWPNKANDIMRWTSDWVFEHARAIEIVVGLGLGATFVLKGGAVLLQSH
jgi:threonine/homoserine/homoserine lactone efflux protein